MRQGTDLFMLGLGLLFGFLLGAWWGSLKETPSGRVAGALEQIEVHDPRLEQLEEHARKRDKLVESCKQEGGVAVSGAYASVVCVSGGVAVELERE